MAELLRVGLVGCGRHGRLLAQALAQVPGAALVACCDPNPAALAGFPGDLARFPSIPAMLDQARLDAAIVATAHAALAEAAGAVVEGGRHVFCEKPFALNAAQARPVVDAARRHGVNLMVGYCLRYDALRLQARGLIERGALGEIAWVGGGKGGRPLDGWLTSREAGGGTLLWLGSHLVDQVNWLLDQRPRRVYAEMARRPDGGTDRTTVFTIRYEGGTLAHLDCSQAAHASYDYLELAGAHGRLRVEWLPRRTLVVHSEVLPEYREPTVIQLPANDHLPMYVAELREFVASILERRPPAIGGEDALRVLEVLDAVAASAEQGAPVVLE